MDSTSIKYATPEEWAEIVKNRSKVRMNELIQRLGLRANWASNKRGKTKFESQLVCDLVASINEIVKLSLPTDAKNLKEKMSQEGSCKAEIDSLLEKHGNKIWGRTGDRTHLLRPNEPGVDEGLYTRDLYFDNDEDRELIRILLHWWTGMKACNTILARERTDRKKRNDDQEAKREVDLTVKGGSSRPNPASGLVALAPNGVPTPVMVGGHFATSQEGYMEQTSASMEAARENIHALSQPPGNGNYSILDPADLQKHVEISHQVRHELSSVVASFNSNLVESGQIPLQRTNVPYGGLSHDVMRALRFNLYKEEGVQWDEETLLQRLEQVWRNEIRADYGAMAQDIRLFVARERAFMVWIELKRHITELDRAEERWRAEGDSAPEIKRRIDQHKTLMACTKNIICNHTDIGHAWKGPWELVNSDEVLRQSFVLLAGERYAAEMEWEAVPFSAVIGWLNEEYDRFLEEEAEENRNMQYYFP